MIIWEIILENENNYKAIITETRQDQVEISKLLIEAGADQNVQDWGRALLALKNIS